MKSARKIASIALVVLSALLVFVGCEQTPMFEMPQSIKSGVITQDGEFLEGQAFDPSKFTVEVVYDNGKTDSFPGASIVTWTPSAEGQIGVNSGDALSAKVGLNSENGSYTAEGVIYAAKIDTITVVPATTSYVVDNWSDLDIPSTDVAVTATFTGRDGEVATVVLKPSEYKVEVVDPSTLNTPSALNPSVNAVAQVTTKVGGKVEATYAIEGTFEAADIDFAFNSISDIKVADDVDLIAFEDATVNFSDFTITVSDGTNTETLTADPGLELTYVDETGRAIESLLNVTSVYVKASAEGCATKTFGPFSVNPVHLNVVSNSTAKFYKGETLPVLEAGDFDVTYSYGTTTVKTKYVDSADVEFAYSTEQNTVKAPADGVVPETGNLYIIAEYKGLTHSIYVTPTDRTYTEVYAPAEQSATVDQVVLSEDYAAPKAQNYTDYETALALDVNDIKSISYMYTAAEKDAKPEVKEESSLTDKIAVKYTTDTNGTALVAGPDALVGLDTIYIEVTYKPVEETEIVYYEPVKLQTAYADWLDVDVQYSDVDENEQPMFGADVELTVNAVNADGIVAELSEGEYNVLKDGKPSTIESVTAEAQTFTINAIVDGADGPKKIVSGTDAATPADVTIAAGYVYYSVSALSVDFKDEAPVCLVDKTWKDVALDTADFVVSGYTPNGTETPLTVSEFIYVTDNVSEGANEVYAKVNYTNAEGEKVSELVEFTLEGTAWIEKGTSTPVVTINETSITSLPAGTYNLTNAVVTNLTKHGDISWSLSAVANNGSASVNGNEFTINEYGGVTVTLSWFDGSAVQTQEYTVNAN